MRERPLECVSAGDRKRSLRIERLACTRAESIVMATIRPCVPRASCVWFAAPAVIRPPDTGAFSWQGCSSSLASRVSPVYNFSAPGGRGRSGQHMAKGCWPLSWLATLVLLGAHVYYGGAATARARSGGALLEAIPG